MKKIVLIVFLSVVFILLSACGNLFRESDKKSQQGYKCYVCDITNDGIIKDAEKDWWLGLSVSDESVAKEKKYKYEDFEFLYEYKNSNYLKNSPERVDVFYNKENGITVKFYSDSGEFAGIHYNTLINDEYFLKEDVDKPYENALGMAKRIASTYINIDEFVIKEEITNMQSPASESEETDESSQFKIYSFEFIKYAGKYATGESVYVNITSKGDLRTLAIKNIGLTDKIKDQKLDEDKLKASVESKLNDLYSEKYKYSYNITKQVFTLSPENQPVIVSDIEVHVESRDGLEYNTGVVLAAVIQ